MWTTLIVLAILSQSSCAETNDEPSRTSFVVSSIMEDPFLMNATGNDTDEHYGYRGYIPDLLNAIAKITNFEFVIRLSSDGLYGSKNDSNWSGMIGDVVNGRADFAAALITVSTLRKEAVDFTQPFMESGITFMIAKPKLDSSLISLFDVVNVVSGEVWGLILVAIAVITVCLLVMDRYFPDQSISFGWKDGSFFLFSTAMWQGYSRAPPSVGARVVSIFWWFFCAVFLMSYSASLVHIFAFKVQTLPKLAATSAEDLFKQSSVQYSPLQSGSTKNFFSDSKAHLNEQLWKGMQVFGEKKFPKTVDEAVQLVRSRDGTYAFFGESLLLDHRANIDPDCGLLVSDQHLDKIFYGFAVTKNNPTLLQNLSDAIISLDDTGFTSALYTSYFSNKCPDHSIRQHAEDRIELQRQPINLHNFGGIFILLVIGIGAGFLIYGSELLLIRRFGKNHIPAMLLSEANMNE